jgi:long-chain acyl-CoA synthetase
MTSRHLINDVIPSLRRHQNARIAWASVGDRKDVAFPAVSQSVAAAATLLQECGVGPGAQVGLFAQNSIDWLIAELACLAIGAVSVPFDRGYPWGQPQQMIAEWDLKVLVTDAWPAGDGVLDIARFSCRQDASLSAYRYAPEECSTVKFSSGTSAQPKAIKARAAHFNHSARHFAAMFPLALGDVFLVMAPLTTWLQRVMAHLAIIQGADVVLVRPEFAVQALESERPALVIGVPRLLEAVYVVHQRRLRRDPNARLLDVWGGRIRYLWTGSAPIQRTILEAYVEGGVPVFEGYGMTETGMIAKNYPGSRRLGSVGRAFPEKNVVIEANGHIMVQSQFHANAGYWRGQSGAFKSDGWVATGDVGHFDDDGYLYVDGRVTDVLVLSTGHKVFPATVEQHLRTHPLIAECVVISHDGEHLVAVVEPSNAAIPDYDIEIALAQLCESLPAHQRVLGFVRSAGFTADNGLRTRNGKLNRGAIGKHYAGVLAELHRNG